MCFIAERIQDDRALGDIFIFYIYIIIIFLIIFLAQF